MTWPDSVERVAVFLRASGSEARLEELETGTGTAQAAAETVGCGLEQIVKSLVFICDERPVLVLVPGDRRADVAKVAAATGGTSVRVAKPPEVLAVTGVQPGSVSPFPPPAGATVLVERTLLSCAIVWVGAGSERHLVRVPSIELVRLTQGVTVDLVKESA